MTETYETADYYDCCDDEEYTHQTPEEAIEGYLDGFLHPKEEPTGTIVKLCPITVTAYAREAVMPDWITRLAEDLVERADEEWICEYGNPDSEGLDPEAKEYLKEEFKRALNVVIAQCTVWSCFKCGSKEYTEEEVLKMMKEHNPHWFDGESNAPPR